MDHLNRHEKQVTRWLTRAWVWASFVQSLVTQWASEKENDQGVSEKGQWRERRGIEMKSIGPKEVPGKAFSGHQRVSECFVKAGLRALISQLWSIHWTLCWPSDPQVKDVWIREEQVNNKCNWSEIQVTLKCPRWNASARRVSRECPPRAGCWPRVIFTASMYLCLYINNVVSSKLIEIYDILCVIAFRIWRQT